ncbi:MAG: holo-ACP synthase [Candidatus Aminicenantales bacterium]
MIIGIGVDIIEVERIQKLAERSPRFLERIFTPEELAYSQQKKNIYQHLAARFAAKEAYFKALGRKTNWKDVSIVNAPSGKPELLVKPRSSLPFQRAHVSVSHIKDYAIAVVVLET